MSVSESSNLHQLKADVASTSGWVQPLRDEIGRVLVGQGTLVDRLLIGLISNGHLLLEGVPGLAKTLSIRTLAGAVNARFSRIQFTPDLLPADIVGTLVYNPRDGVFSTKKGPVFANLVLADEINRAPAKVQSALLEAMQEKQVTLGDESHRLPSPFLVLATENPIDQEGTYPLPEAQLDRFMLKLKVGYPSREEEREILNRMASNAPTETVRPIVQPETILQARTVVDRIHVDERIKDYIIDLVVATREPATIGLDLKHLIEFGASPRATIALTLAARARAFLQGRAFVTPSDVKSLAPDVMRHRVIISYEAEAEGLSSEDLIDRILAAVPTP